MFGGLRAAAQAALACCTRAVPLQAGARLASGTASYTARAGAGPAARPGPSAVFRPSSLSSSSSIADFYAVQSDLANARLQSGSSVRRLHSSWRSQLAGARQDAHRTLEGRAAQLRSSALSWTAQPQSSSQPGCKEALASALPGAKSISHSSCSSSKSAGAGSGGTSAVVRSVRRKPSAADVAAAATRARRHGPPCCAALPDMVRCHPSDTCSHTRINLQHSESHCLDLFHRPGRLRIASKSSSSRGSTRSCAVRRCRLAPVVGFAAGLFGSLVGVGGGVIIVPALVGLCPGVPQRSVPPPHPPRPRTRPLTRAGGGGGGGGGASYSHFQAVICASAG